jgi:hypothetical protein
VEKLHVGLVIDHWRDLFSHGGEKMLRFNTRLGMFVKELLNMLYLYLKILIATTTKILSYIFNIAIKINKFITMQHLYHEIWFTN